MHAVKSWSLLIKTLPTMPNGRLKIQPILLSARHTSPLSTATGSRHCHRRVEKVKGKRAGCQERDHRSRGHKTAQAPAQTTQTDAAAPIASASATAPSAITITSGQAVVIAVTAGKIAAVSGSSTNCPIVAALEVSVAEWIATRLGTVNSVRRFVFKVFFA